MSATVPIPERARSVVMHPIGVVRTDATTLPRHWSVSDVEGTLELSPEYLRGLEGIEAGKTHRRAVSFRPQPRLHGRPPDANAAPSRRLGERACSASARRCGPNPIGLSVLEVLSIEGGRIEVRGLDMLDGTPILDIKPHITGD